MAETKNVRREFEPSLLVGGAIFCFWMVFFFEVIGPLINPNYPYDTENMSTVLVVLGMLFAGIESAVRRVEAALERHAQHNIP